MKNRDALLEQIDVHSACLSDQTIPKLDFDALAATLHDVRELLASPTSDEQATILRRDYQLRIAGMLKAIAAVKNTSEALEAATAEIEQLDSLPAQQLIDRYRKTSARFRDAFPASSGLLHRPERMAAPRDITDYK